MPEVRGAHQGDQLPRSSARDVVLHGADLTEARAHAGELAARDGLTFIHPFDNADVIAGQGTMGLEILEQTPDVEADRRSGRRRRPARGHRHGRQGEGAGGVESSASSRSARRASPRRSPRDAPVDRRRCRPRSPTASPSASWAMRRSRSLKRVVDRVVTVDEATIALAILRLIELEKSVVEGAGAAPLAAFLAGKLDMLKGKRVVLVLCGGNIDSHDARPRHRGRASSPTAGSAAFTVTISDRPGGLARLAEIIASAGASIKEIVHDRAFAGPDLSAVRVVCVVETTGHDHVERLHRKLEAAGLPVDAGSRPDGLRRPLTVSLQSFGANSRFFFSIARWCRSRRASTCRPSSGSPAACGRAPRRCCGCGAA